MVLSAPVHAHTPWGPAQVSAYYNEIDPFKAAVLREAIKAGAIAPGDVDERSIADVQPGEIVGYTQCHFFAGGGFWSLALRLAGWPDDRAVWTGSCPCPSFSAAGKGLGFADPRHLWPEWYRLIRECRPARVFGEQVAAAIGHGWLDLVCGDMEAEGYAIAAAVLGAHSAGAPHIRQRLYFGAHAAGSGHDGRRSGEAGFGIEAGIGIGGEYQPERLCDACSHPHICKSWGRQCDDAGQRSHADGRLPGNGDVQRGGQHGLFAADRGTGECEYADAGGSQVGRPAGVEGMGRCADGRQAGSPISAETPEPGDCAHNGGDTLGEQRGQERAHGRRRGEGSSPEELEQRSLHDGAGIGHQSISPRLEGHFGDVREWRGPGWLDPLTARSVAAAGATRGFWADCDWWYGRDGKYRPIGPGLQPLAHGSSARVGRLRMYGDAINVETAKEFIASAMEAMEEVAQ